MLNFIFMIGLSLYLTGYGFIALFKQEWLLKLRSFSARVEGKSGIKTEDLVESRPPARTAIAILSLVLGIIGLVVSISTAVIFIAAQNGPIAV